MLALPCKRGSLNSTVIPSVFLNIKGAWGMIGIDENDLWYLVLNVNVSIFKYSQISVIFTSN